MKDSHTLVRRKATNVSLDSELLDAAKELGVNVSRACERGLAERVAEMRSQRWLEENRQALESSNRYIEAKGLPLDRYRRF